MPSAPHVLAPLVLAGLAASLSLACLLAQAPAAAAQVKLRVSRSSGQNTDRVDGVERPFFTGLSAATGIQAGTACATSATSGNTGYWPGVTTHVLPHGLSGAVQGHLMTLAAWRRLTTDQQAAVVRKFDRMEDRMWGGLAATTDGNALSCSTGGECREHTRFGDTRVAVTEED